MIVGILALQGNFIQHKKFVDKIGVQNILVRHPNEINQCDSLIMPGGESTSISKQIDNNQFRKKLIEFALAKPILGTCAGMIMLSTSMPRANMSPLNIMDFHIERNAWGSQVNSFSANINLNFDENRPFHAIFIRAPKISKIGKDVHVLATFDGEPVLLSNGMHIVSSFHPEIGEDYRIHEYFINNNVDETIPALS